VLEILVGSGLLLQNLSQAEPTYQLVHDYIAEFVREQQVPDLLAQMQAEREKRQVAERQLSEVQQEGERLTRENQKAKKRLQLSTVLASILLLVAGGASFWAVGQIKDLDEKTKGVGQQLRQADQQRWKSELSAAQTTFTSAQNETNPARKIKQLEDAYEFLSSSQTFNLESLVLAMRLALARNQVNGQLKTSLFTGALRRNLYLNRERDRFTLIEKNSAIRNIIWHGNEARVITASQNNVVTVWNFQEQRLLTLKGHQGIVLSASFSPNGQRIVTASSDGTAKIWNLQGKELLTIKGDQRSFRSASFSPDSQRIITVSLEDTAKVWNLQGKELITLKGHQSGVNIIDFSTINHRADFSPDGQQIVTVSRDKTAIVWNLQGKKLITLKGHRQPIKSAIFSPDGQRIITTSYDRTAKVWNLQGKELFTLKGYQGGIMSASFSPNGQRIITTGGDGIAKVWDWQGKALMTLEQGAGEHAKFSADGQRILSADYKTNTARILDLRSQPLVTLQGATEEKSGQDQNSYLSSSFSPSGKHIITTWNIPKQSEDLLTKTKSVTKVWNLQGKKLLTFAGVDRIEFSNNDQRFITSDGKEAIVWNLQGQRLWASKGFTQISPDGQRIIEISWRDKTAKVWSLKGRLLLLLKGAYDASFSPDSQRIITRSSGDDKTSLDDNIVQVWDLQGRELLKLQRTDEGRFNRDGQRRIITQSEKTVKLWDLQGRLLLTLKGDWGNTDFSPDGQRIITSSNNDQTVQIWDLQGRELLKLKDTSSARFSHDGQRIIADGKLLDLQGRELAEIEGSLSPDGRWFVGTSGDGIARIWPVESLETLLAKGCDWLRDYLTTNRDAPEDLQQFCRVKPTPRP